jgi:hypothetical protein
LIELLLVLGALGGNYWLLLKRPSSGAVSGRRRLGRLLTLPTRDRDSFPETLICFLAAKEIARLALTSGLVHQAAVLGVLFAVTVGLPGGAGRLARQLVSLGGTMSAGFTLLTSPYMDAWARTVAIVGILGFLLLVGVFRTLIAPVRPAAGQQFSGAFLTLFAVVESGLMTAELFVFGFIDFAALQWMAILAGATLVAALLAVIPVAGAAVLGGVSGLASLAVASTGAVEGETEALLGLAIAFFAVAWLTSRTRRRVRS